MHIGIEHRNSEQQADEAWSQQSWRVTAEENVYTVEKSEAEVEQGWTEVVRERRKGVCTSGVVVATSKRMAGMIVHKGDILKATVMHEGRIARAWFGFLRRNLRIRKVLLSFRRYVYQKGGTALSNVDTNDWCKIQLGHCL